MVDKVARIVLFVAFLGLGLYLLVVGGRELSMGLASARWAQGEGRVADWNVELDTRYRQGGRTDTYWLVDVVYAYDVGGAEYTSTIKSRYPSQQGADEFLARYPVDKPLTVYYDPEDPERAVLERGIGWMTVLKLLAGLAFASVGIWWLVGILRRTPA
jgi:hypothetical protein